MITLAKVDNELYRRLGHAWWDDNVGEFSTIRFFINPVRFGFFSRVLKQMQHADKTVQTVLDVGCGGGILTEEFARLGYHVTGIDPAPESVETARAHAKGVNLSIEYKVGYGENLPFAKASFDIVTCCDVLEHVDDVGCVLHEIARVVKPGGLFFYDTINRTMMSKIAVIKVLQEWPSTAFAEPNTHAWERFIKPQELVDLLERYSFDNYEMRGISIWSNPIAAWLNFRRRVQGKITFKELGQRLGFHESNDLGVSYMGAASKRSENAS
jgi:2-polyprenyl-6-hydroxyphenyl methylase / 3-demethylubiquinone-9 3-methyltransferase